MNASRGSTSSSSPSSFRSPSLCCCGAGGCGGGGCWTCGGSGAAAAVCSCCARHAASLASRAAFLSSALSPPPGAPAAAAAGGWAAASAGAPGAEAVSEAGGTASEASVGRTGAGWLSRRLRLRLRRRSRDLRSGQRNEGKGITLTRSQFLCSESLNESSLAGRGQTCCGSCSGDARETCCGGGRGTCCGCGHETCCGCSIEGQYKGAGESNEHESSYPGGSGGGGHCKRESTCGASDLESDPCCATSTAWSGGPCSCSSPWRQSVLAALCCRQTRGPENQAVLMRRWRCEGEGLDAKEAVKGSRLRSLARCPLNSADAGNVQDAQSPQRTMGRPLHTATACRPPPAASRSAAVGFAF